MPPAPLTVKAVALVCIVGSALAQAAPGAGRIAAPPGLACPRDQLTLLAGTVLAYQREPTAIHLRIRTDWASDETLELHLASTVQWLDGQPLADHERARIEASPIAAVPGLRVRIWLCEDGRTPPVVDWQPAKR